MYYVSINSCRHNLAYIHAVLVIPTYYTSYTGWAKKVSLRIFATTLSTGPPCILYIFVSALHNWIYTDNMVLAMESKP